MIHRSSPVHLMPIKLVLIFFLAVFPARRVAGTNAFISKQNLNDLNCAQESSNYVCPTIDTTTIHDMNLTTINITFTATTTCPADVVDNEFDGNVLNAAKTSQGDSPCQCTGDAVVAIQTDDSSQQPTTTTTTTPSCNCNLCPEGSFQNIAYDCNDEIIGTCIGFSCSGVCIEEIMDDSTSLPTSSPEEEGDTSITSTAGRKSQKASKGSPVTSSTGSKKKKQKSTKKTRSKLKDSIDGEQKQKKKKKKESSTSEKPKHKKLVKETTTEPKIKVSKAYSSISQDSEDMFSGGTGGTGGTTGLPTTGNGAYNQSVGIEDTVPNIFERAEGGESKKRQLISNYDDRRRTTSGEDPSKPKVTRRTARNQKQSSNSSRNKKHKKLTKKEKVWMDISPDSEDFIYFDSEDVVFVSTDATVGSEEDEEKEEHEVIYPTSSPKKKGGDSSHNDAKESYRRDRDRNRRQRRRAVRLQQHQPSLMTSLENNGFVS